jgi:Rieske Fe-S protein
MDRRQLLKALGFGTLGCALGAGGLCAISDDRQPLPVVLGQVADFAPGTVHSFPVHGVAVLRVTEGLAVISTRCTHLGCALHLVGEEWLCPCHGGRFTVDGRPVAGPPRSPLAWLEAAQGPSGEIYVYPARENREHRHLTVI